MPEPDDHRAVTALFRFFGGKRRSDGMVTGLRTDAPGMHRGERVFYATAVPLSVWAFVGEVLGGYWWAVLAALPLSFVLLNLLVIAVQARTLFLQWLSWLALLTGWSAWLLWNGAVGWIAWLAWAWVVFAGLNAMAEGVGFLRRSMDWNGKLAMRWRLFLLIAAHGGAVALGFFIGWPWAIFAGMAISGLYCLMVLRPGCQCLGTVVTKRADDGILITIDDGPDPVDTPKLLDLLDVYQKKAVFFMIGEKVERYPELAREVLRRGHEIGNHTMTHPQAWFWCASPRRTRWEIETCQKTIETITGVAPRWFRAPVGHRNAFTHPVTRELGLEVMGWSRRGFDAVEKDARKVLDGILPGLRAGDIVLLHESTPIAAEVLGGVLAEISKNP
ncbi:MAG: polysaccharide deacetylase family protein [Luteolibacter sp.]